MKAICPNSLEHDRFITSVIVTQDWIVNETGHFIATSDECVDVLKDTSKYNFWQCEICGAEALVEDDDY